MSKNKGGHIEDVVTTAVVLSPPTAYSKRQLVCDLASSLIELRASVDAGWS